jgi:hypothetical protein
LSGSSFAERPPEHGLGKRARRQAVEVGARVLDQTETDLVGRDLAIEQPGLGARILQRLGEQVVHLDHVDAALAHLGDEVEMVALGVLHPQHVIEQQRVAVGRGQPLVGASRRAHQHLGSWPTSECTP